MVGRFRMKVVITSDEVESLCVSIDSFRAFLLLLLRISIPVTYSTSLCRCRWRIRIWNLNPRLSWSLILYPWMKSVWSSSFLLASTDVTRWRNLFVRYWVSSLSCHVWHVLCPYVSLVIYSWSRSSILLFSHWFFGFVSSGVGWFTCPAFLFLDLWRVFFFSSAQLLFFPRCYPRSIVIISFVFYFIEIKQLFPFIGLSPSGITGPGYGRLFVQASLTIADRLIPIPFVIRPTWFTVVRALFDISLSWEPHRAPDEDVIKICDAVVDTSEDLIDCFLKDGGRVGYAERHPVVTE